MSMRSERRPEVPIVSSARPRVAAPPVLPERAARPARWPWLTTEASEVLRSVAATAAQHCAELAAVSEPVRPMPATVTPASCRWQSASRSGVAGTGGRVISRRSPASNHETAASSGVFHRLCGQNAKCVRMVRMPQHRGEIAAAMCLETTRVPEVSRPFMVGRNSLSRLRLPAENKPAAVDVFGE